MRFNSSSLTGYDKKRFCLWQRTAQLSMLNTVLDTLLYQRAEPSAAAGPMCFIMCRHEQPGDTSMAQAWHSRFLKCCSCHYLPHRHLGPAEVCWAYKCGPLGGEFILVPLVQTSQGLVAAATAFVEAVMSQVRANVTQQQLGNSSLQLVWQIWA